jgi:hypothetical protein
MFEVFGVELLGLLAKLRAEQRRREDAVFAADNFHHLLCAAAAKERIGRVELVQGQFFFAARTRFQDCQASHPFSIHYYGIRALEQH